MSEKQLKQQANSSNLRLTGDKINLEVRDTNRSNTATIKTNNLMTKYYNRPVSAVPLLALNGDDDNVEEDVKKDRPFSADFTNIKLDNFEELTSTKLLKTLLSEPIKSWRHSVKQPGNSVETKKIHFIEDNHVDDDPGIDAIHDYLTIKYGKNDDCNDDLSINSICIDDHEGNQQKLQIQNWIDDSGGDTEKLLPELSKIDIDELFKDDTDRKFEKYFEKSPKSKKSNEINKNRVKFITDSTKTTELVQNQTDKKQNYLDFLDSLDDLIDTKPQKEIDREITKTTTTTTTTTSESNEDIASIMKDLEAEHEKSQKNMKSIQQIIDKEITPKIIVTEIDDNSNNDKNQENKQDEIPSTLTQSTNYKQILSFLDEVDKDCSKPLDEIKCNLPKFDTIKLDTIPKFEDLILYRNDELARYIIDLSLRLKDKSSSIKLLQTELTNLREQIVEQNRKQTNENRIKLKTQKDEYESTIKRHQKFIDQLINDKKSLKEQCECLINEIKTLEQRYQSNLKSLEHKQQLEIEKLKNIQTINEKIRRERWIDNRTQKIKQQTVKSIEPELKDMERRQQQELNDLRTLHKKEIEEIELKHSRKMQQQLENLRMEMLEERERILKNEREILQKRYNDLIENEQKSLQEQRKRLLNEHEQRIRECEERENNVMNEREKFIKQIQNEYEERLQSVIRRHNNEINLIKESMNIELEQWKNNYKKQQQANLNQYELELREQLRKERDLEIEKVIERLENESNEQRKQIEQTTENRIKRLKDKYEKEINDLEQLQNEYKIKYNNLKQQIINNDDNIMNLNNKIKQQQKQLDDNRNLIEQLQNERQQYKEIVRNEMKNEMEMLNKELMMLKETRDKEMQQLHSRVRVSVARKDEILSELTRDNKNLQEKCAYLENMLEQKRKEYLMK